EHTFPRAELAGSSSHPSEDDLHNLFPTRVRVNGDRGNLPFAEIPDALTTRWYRGETATTTDPPSAERDGWSELRTGSAFEPREAHEGNVARAMFYVATVWDDAADLAWFAGQQTDLYEWHRADPVDQAEVDRSERVAFYQRDASGTPLPNPFVVDSTLIRRAFFVTVAAEPEPEASVHLALLGPNPFRETTRILVHAPRRVRVSVVDVLGREVAVLADRRLGGGEEILTVSGLAPGIYTVRAVTRTGAVTRRLARIR
ncbi:MAG: endonuclease, partial [Bacteroidota bacterium]